MEGFHFPLRWSLSYTPAASPEIRGPGRGCSIQNTKAQSQRIHWRQRFLIHLKQRELPREAGGSAANHCPTPRPGSNPIPYILGNRNTSSNGFSQVALKPAFSGWDWKIPWREHSHVPGLYHPHPHAHPHQGTPSARSVEPWLSLSPLFFHPTRPGFSWDK